MSPPGVRDAPQRLMKAQPLWEHEFPRSLPAMIKSHVSTWPHSAHLVIRGNGQGQQAPLLPRRHLQGQKTGTSLVGPLFWLCRLVTSKQHKNNPELMLSTKDTRTAAITDSRHRNYDLKINPKNNTQVVYSINRLQPRRIYQAAKKLQLPRITRQPPPIPKYRQVCLANISLLDKDWFYILSGVPCSLGLKKKNNCMRSPQHFLWPLCSSLKALLPKTVLPHSPAARTSSICSAEQLWESLSNENEVTFYILKSHSSSSFSQWFLKAHFSNLF